MCSLSWLITKIPGKVRRYSLKMKLCGPRSRSGRFEECLVPTGIRTPTVQPVASRCMDCITPAPGTLIIKVILIYRLQPFHTLMKN